jgi:hypothetical protein
MSPDYGSGGWGFESLAAPAKSQLNTLLAGLLIALTPPGCDQLRPRRRPLPKRLRPSGDHYWSAGSGRCWSLRPARRARPATLPRPCNSNLRSIQERITIEREFEGGLLQGGLMSLSTSPADRSESEAGDAALPSAAFSLPGRASASGDGIRQGRRRLERRRLRQVRIRVNARGAAYVPGLQEGQVYDARIKVRWPGTAWPLRTGLSHRFFLLAGMYEVVQDAEEQATGTHAAKAPLRRADRGAWRPRR